VKTANNKR